MLKGRYGRGWMLVAWLGIAAAILVAGMIVVALTTSPVIMWGTPPAP